MNAQAKGTLFLMWFGSLELRPSEHKPGILRTPEHKLLRPVWGLNHVFYPFRGENI